MCSQKTLSHFLHKRRLIYMGHRNLSSQCGNCDCLGRKMATHLSQQFSHGQENAEQNFLPGHGWFKSLLERPVVGVSAGASRRHREHSNEQNPRKLGRLNQKVLKITQKAKKKLNKTDIIHNLNKKAGHQYKKKKKKTWFLKAKKTTETLILRKLKCSISSKFLLLLK